MRYLAYNALTGEVGHGITVSHRAAIPLPDEGSAWVETPGDPWLFAIELLDGVPTAVALQPSTDEQLKAARAARKQDADRILSMHIEGTVEVGAGVVQCGIASREAIAARLREAQAAGPEWRTRWRLADNSFSAELDAAGMAELDASVGQFITACRSASWAVKAAIDAAATPADAAAVDVTAGYPATTRS